jgi:hypothetical protein
MIDPATVLDWLEAGDVAIRYQTRRDLRGVEQPRLQARITAEGWGAALLAKRNPDGSWGRGFYQPKWTSSHYTLLDLKLLNAPRGNRLIRDSISKISRTEKKPDGGIGPGISIAVSDVCVNGMFLNYASYFGASEADLASIVDFILTQRMDDGGFNCQRNRGGARHSSLHSTLSVLEGIAEYAAAAYRYRLGELQQAAADGRAFMLQHRLFKSDHTGEVIRSEFLRFAYPPRWKYNVLRALDYFASAGVGWDDRLGDAIEVVESKRRSDGRWLAVAPLAGDVHFAMETAGRPSRWNTLVALRVLKAFSGHTQPPGPPQPDARDKSGNTPGGPAEPAPRSASRQRVPDTAQSAPK